MKEVRQARRELHRSLQENRRKHVQASGDSIEEAMEAGKVQEAKKQISRWYRQERGEQAPPTTYKIYEVIVARDKIYRCRPLEGLKVPLLVRKVDIKDVIPT